jgi:type IV secretion system protein VirB10
MQDRKLAFISRSPPRNTLCRQDSVIPAALLTGIRSDLPGQVTENVYDSPTGRYLLIPQGSKLIGIYDGQVSFGQSRVLLVGLDSSFRTAVPLCLNVSRVLIPKAMPDSRTRSIIIGADCSSQLLSRHCLASAPNSVLAAPTAISSARCVGAVRIPSTRPVRRNLNVQPTLTIRPGFPVRVIVNRDLVLAPYPSCGGIPCPS